MQKLSGALRWKRIRKAGADSLVRALSPSRLAIAKVQVFEQPMQPAE